jgi:hypothetical protein
MDWVMMYVDLTKDDSLKWMKYDSAAVTTQPLKHLQKLH